MYLHSLWIRSVPQRLFSCTEHVSECGSYPRGPSPVPNTFRIAVRTPEAHLLYRTRFEVRFVPQRPFSCTEHVSECGSYPRGPSPVPNTFRIAVRTPEAHLLYRTRFGVRFVPQRPFSCTEHVSDCGSYPRGPLSCTEHVSECGLYPRGPSPVPNTFRSAVRTPETLLLYRTRFGLRFVPQRPPLLYRTRFGVRFVPQRPFSCTEHVSECGLYPRGPSPVPNCAGRVFVPQKA